MEGVFVIGFTLGLGVAVIIIIVVDKIMDRKCR